MLAGSIMNAMMVVAFEHRAMIATADNTDEQMLFITHIYIRCMLPFVIK